MNRFASWASQKLTEAFLAIGGLSVEPERLEFYDQAPWHVNEAASLGSLAASAQPRVVSAQGAYPNINMSGREEKQAKINHQERQARLEHASEVEADSKSACINWENRKKVLMREQGSVAHPNPVPKQPATPSPAHLEQSARETEAAESIRGWLDTRLLAGVPETEASKGKTIIDCTFFDWIFFILQDSLET